MSANMVVEGVNNTVVIDDKDTITNIIEKTVNKTVNVTKASSITKSEVELIIANQEKIMLAAERTLKKLNKLLKASNISDKD